MQTNIVLHYVCFLGVSAKKSFSEEFDIGYKVIHKFYELKTMYGIF